MYMLSGTLCGLQWDHHESLPIYSFGVEALVPPNSSIHETDLVSKQFDYSNSREMFYNVEESPYL